MPTNLIQSSASYEGDIHVLATEQGLRSPRMLTIDLTAMDFDADGNKLLRSGQIIVKLASGLGAPYKASKLGVATATNSAALTPSQTGLFRVGDALVVAAPHASVTFALTWANGDTAEVTIDGTPYEYTVADYSTLAALATTYAAGFNASDAGAKATAIASGATVHFFGKAGGASIAVASLTAGDGTLTVTGSATALESGKTVGTVSSIAEDGVITLGANAAIALPSESPIKALNQGQIYGMVLTPHIIASQTNALAALSNDVACYTSASVYGARLPYWDAACAAALPEITLV